MDNIGDIKSFLGSIKNPSSGNQNDNGFNVFSLCQVWHKENIHSAILASLLDPKGEHGLGTLPLKLFLNIIGIEQNETQLIGARVTTEEPIYGGGRRLDILITGKDFRVIIENKTITCDHEGQLDDYYDWLRKYEEKNKKLLYLTYNGSRAVNAKKAQYTPIAYNSDITDWLDKCVNEIDNRIGATEIRDRDFLTKTIIQYKEFLRKLTEGEKMDINEGLLKNIIDNFSAAEEVVKNIDNAKAYWIWTHILSELMKYGFEIDRTLEDMYREKSDKKDVYFWHWDDAKRKKVVYGFRHYGFNDPKREIIELDANGNEIITSSIPINEFNWGNVNELPAEIISKIVSDAETSLRIKIQKTELTID